MRETRENHGYDCRAVRVHKTLRHLGNVAVSVDGFFEGKVDLVFNDQTNDRLRIHDERLTVKLDIVDGTIVLFKSQIRF